MPFFTHDEAEIYYTVGGSGPPALYLAGFSGHISDPIAQGLLAALREHYTVLALDNRGAGQTKTPADTPVTIEMMADDAAALLRHLEMEPAHVVGLSMGGIIAMMLALRHPERVKSQVVAVTMARYQQGSMTDFVLESQRAMVDAGIDLALIMRYRMTIVLGESSFTQEAFIEQMKQAPPDPYAQTRTGYEQQIGALRALGDDLLTQINSLMLPTMVMSSNEDMLVPSHFQDEIANTIPDAILRRYPGGHLFFAQPAYAPAFLQDVIGFWSQHD